MNAIVPEMQNRMNRLMVSMVLGEAEEKAEECVYSQNADCRYKNGG
jgi:hypothetical protein